MFSLLKRLINSDRGSNLSEAIHTSVRADVDSDWVKNISKKVHSKDNMCLRRDKDHYFATSRGAVKCIENALAIANSPEPRKILDLPCGYGRALRSLRARFPEAEITACDILEKGVDFCAKTFEAKGVKSDTEVSRIPIHEKFDLIFVGSLLTHLPEKKTLAFMNWFIDHLEDNGILVVTFHGRFSKAVQNGVRSYTSDENFKKLYEDYVNKGYGYTDNPPPKAGISMTKVSWIMENIIEPRDNVRLLCYTERGWDDHQDVLALVKSPIYKMRERDLRR